MKKLALLGLGVLSLQASALKDIVENASVDGYARVEYIYTDGRDGYGQGFRAFFRPNVTTGEVKGFSFTGGLFFSKGSAAPDGNQIADFIGGSRSFDVKNNKAIDVFSVSNLYVTKKFDSAKTTIRAGIMQIETPLNSPSGSYGDRGMGAFIKNNSVTGMEFFIGTWGSWMTDNVALQTYGLRSISDFGIGNELTIVGAKGNFESVGLKDLTATLYYAYADRLFDMMLFGELGYQFNFENNAYVKIMAQAAGTIMASNPHFFGQGASSPLYNYFVEADKIDQGYARNRGVYNIQLSWGVKNYTGNLGYLGSFAQGYGAMLDSGGDLKVGGTLWNTLVAGGVPGFGWTGSGAYKGTDIIVAYTTHTYKLDNWTFGLGLTYVGGNNRLPQMSKGSNRIKGTTADRGGATVGKASNLTMDADIFEISPSISYQFTKSLSANIAFSQIVGDMIVNRTKVTVMYKF